MEAYLDNIITEYYDSIGAAWVDITTYVVGDIKGNNGLGGWRPDQRVAILGTLNITLNNKGKLFSPMGGDALRGLTTLQGFIRGAKIRVRGVFEGVQKVIWTGRIMSIDSDDLNWGNEHARLYAVDWMHIPSNYPMQGATIALSKTIDQAMSLIVARLYLQPEATDFDTGVNVFPAVFDNVQRKTMALSEFTKLANSELGYIYVTQDGTLVAENMLARQGWRALDTVWVPATTDSFLLLEDGNYLLLEDGGKLVLDEGATAAVALSADAEKYDIKMPEDTMLNASIIRVHPVITDTSLKVLYKLGTPLFIPSGTSYPFSAHYTDPNGLSQVSGTNMQTPVATTDYLANTAADGSGTNKTSDIVVTATYYGDVVEYSIANNASAGVYITFLQARGYGIYYGNSIESNIEDPESPLLYGYAPFQFDQRYQKDTYLADVYGLAVLREYRTPKSRITNIKYLANLNPNHMMSFLSLSIGSLIQELEDRSNLTNHYYITDRAFTIKQGGIINVEYGVKQNDSYLSGGLNPITVDFRGPGGLRRDSLDYGYLPYLADLPNRSISAWINVDAFSGLVAVICGMYSDDSGFMLYETSTNPHLVLAVKYATNQQFYSSPNNSLSTGSLIHVVMTRPRTTYDVLPIFYINGAAVTVTGSAGSPAGLPTTELGNRFTIGNVKTATVDNIWGIDGRVSDLRMYNRILTAAEVTTLYNAGVPDKSLVTDGIVFQGPAVYADVGTAASLAGYVLSSRDRLTENALRMIGIPNDSPIINANP